MSDTLRAKLIRVAHDNPELRPHLLPILKQADVPLSGKTEYFDLAPALRALALAKARVYAVNYNREHAGDEDFQPWSAEDLFITRVRDRHGGVSIEIQDGTSYALYVDFNLGTFEIDPA